MKHFEFHLSISSDSLLDYYRGRARQVVAHCADGETVQFPALLLKQFVDSSGVHGDFVLTCDDNLKNPVLRRLSTDR